MARGRLEHLHTYARSTHDVQIPEHLVGFELLPGTRELLEQARRSMPKLLTERKYAILARRLDEGVEQTYFVLDGGKVVGWAHQIRGRGPNSRINHTLRLHPTDVFFYDDAVEPTHRRRGLHSFMILRRLQLAQEMGCTRAVTEITDRNTASIRSYTNLGFVPRSKIIYAPRLHRAVELPLRPRWLQRVTRRLRGR